MSLAFCIYDLTIDVNSALKAFARIVGHLGLSHERVMVDAPERSPPTQMRLDRLGSVNELFSGIPAFSFEVASGDPTEATLHNAAAYVSYLRAGSRDSLTVFSPQSADLRGFAQRFISAAPGKYGFGMDWSRPGSFYGYSHGFEDFRSTGGDLLGTSDAGRWGELYLPERLTLFDQPIIRDIYPVNLLTGAQLDRVTREGTVRNLIFAHEEWGSVSRLADNWFMWCVPPNEIEAVRQVFQSRGLLKNS